MNRQVPILLLMITMWMITGCREELDEIYQRPEWLAGKLFTMIEEQDQFGTFSRALEMTGYDTIINVSGSYTVFAPSDGAFSEFFQTSASYSSLEDIPSEELNRIVKYHIVQNPWTRAQLRSLDVRGWIDPEDLENDSPKGFKRETLLLIDDWIVGVDVNEKDHRTIIVDSTEGNFTRRVIQESRKYAPIFFQEFLDIYNLQFSDFEFYFDRPFEGSASMYFAGARILGSEIFAENGFIYEIDRVVTPLRNGKEILAEEGGSFSYMNFFDVINQFPEFEFNQERTNDQEGVELGLQVDSLFNLRYPEFAFDIHNEKTQPPKGTTGLPENVTIRYHHGLVAPTDQAFNEFLNAYLVGEGRWGDLESSPPYFKKIIANTHMSYNSIYPSDFERGFLNGEGDYVEIDPSTIVEKEFGSNCTFIGLDKAIVPRAFRSVTGPVFLKRNYSIAMNAIQASDVLSALKKKGKDYMLFVESDLSLAVDSSLIYEETTESFLAYVLVPESAAEPEGLSIGEVRTLLLNHIALTNPERMARKEFIENLAGNHLIVNNETGEIRGTAPTTFGYSGSTPDPNFPVQISTDADNGTTWEINNWFSFNRNTIYNRIASTYPGFHQLLVRADLVNQKEYRYTFLSDNQVYTVFIPSDSLVNTIEPDSMSMEELRGLLQTHFIQGDLIFTDGKLSSGFYETTRIDESSTPFTTVYSKIYIETGYDEIIFPDKNGGVYLEIEESENTNYVTSRRSGDVSSAFPVIVTSGVIHNIDRLLVFDEMDSGS